MRRFILFMLFFLIIISVPCAATKKSITLLTISKSDDDFIGGTAEMILEIKAGSGRIFIDSFPISKMDTQISTRFANDMACNFLERDCSAYDFFYTIRANSNIVGGPSAGAATTVLTIASLDNLDIQENIAITGTINSGGLIGPVGGIKEKIEAAKDVGMVKVLIPSLTFLNDTNLSDVEDINIIKVGSVEDAVLEVTGKLYPSHEDQGVSKAYSVRMNKVASAICERTAGLKTRLLNINSSAYNASDDKLNLSSLAFEEAKYYSAASYCFSTNVRFKEKIVEQLGEEEWLDTKDKADTSINAINKWLDKKKLETIPDLETYMVVKERLSEARDTLNNTNSSNNSTYDIAYAYERVQSAVAWSKFFGLEGRQFVLDEPALKEGCLKKISDVEERIDYFNLYLPLELNSIRAVLDKAYAELKKENYAVCLFKASKAKAEIDVIISSMSVKEELVPELIDQKLKLAKRVILKEQAKDIFPILGYSYFEYAHSLKNENPYSSLLFAEYALELSNLDVYFPKKSVHIPIVEPEYYYIFILGILIGFIAGILVYRHATSKKEMKKAIKKNTKIRMKREKTQEDSKKSRNLLGKKR